MKITLLCITDSDKHFAQAIKEYTKRLPKKLIIHDIKPTKHTTPKQIIQSDTEQILKRIQKIQSKNPQKVILLSKTGKLHDTQTLKKIINKENTMTIVIGGPYGLDEKKLETQVDEKRSLGRITLPHGLAKLTILEQIYRVQTILQGKKYHY